MPVKLGRIPLETQTIRVTLITPDITESEAGEYLSDLQVRENCKLWEQIAIPADAIEQPDEVDVGEIIVRPTVSTF